jgi:serine/threonine-protein phosphatase 2A regulatory subunit A
VLPLVLSMAADPVPNIRFNVSKTLATLAPRLGGGAIEGQIRPALNSLIDDPDRDVRYFTRKAIAALG